MNNTFRSFLVICLCIAATTSCAIQGHRRIREFCQSQENALGPSITLVSWNVYKGKRGKDALKEDITDIIQKTRADILLIQEGKADLFDIEGMGADFATSFRWPWWTTTPNGVMTFSNVEPIEVQGEHADQREEFFFLPITPKSALVTKYFLKGRREMLLVINVHCLNFERWGTSRLREQLNELQEIMQQHRGPIILAGDFNTWNKKRLKVVSSVAHKVGLSEVTGFPEGRTTGDTGVALMNFLWNIDPTLPLDRVYSRGLKIHKSEVLAGYISSDHIPLYVAFKLL